MEQTHLKFPGPLLEKKVKMFFEEMSDVILVRIEIIKNDDIREKLF